MGKRIFEKFKELARKYGKKDLKVEWDASESSGSDCNSREGSEKKAVYVALPISTLERFLKYLRIE